MSKIIRILCDVEGYGEFWIEFDVSTWTIAEFVDIPVQSAFGALYNYVAHYATDWNIIGDNGAVVPCPKQGSGWEIWKQVFEQIGPDTGKDIYTWLCMSVLAALSEATSPSPKSDGAG